jgi:hypothetical protein
MIDPATESGSLLPSFLSILFPDFENAVMPSAAQSDDIATDGFIIDNLSKARWATAKILEAEARITRRLELAREFKTRIDQWLESASLQDNDSISYLSILLEPYVKNEVSKLYKSRTLSLPCLPVLRLSESFPTAWK